MYTLNTEAAKQADQMGGVISESGKYIGTFTRAENVRSDKGTIGVEFSFKSNDGLSADYLTLWTKNANGDELRGYKILMAIMTCLRVRAITPVIQPIEKYDHTTKSKQTVRTELFPELMGKPIGLLIQMEEYLKKDQTTAWKPSIFAPFGASDEFTASEILNKATKPETLAKMLHGLKDRPLRKGPAQAHDHGPAPTGGFADFNDTIDF